MKKNAVCIFVVLLVIAVAGGLLLKRKHDLAQARPASVLQVVVDAVVPNRQKITLTLPAMGLVCSDLSATLSTKISGRVTSFYKKEGDYVKKGDLLASIDDTEILAKKETIRLKHSSLNFDLLSKKSTLNALQTTQQNIQDTHRRTKELLDVKGASIEQYKNEETEIAQLVARIETIKGAMSMLREENNILIQNEKEIDNQLSYASITSPIDGTVSTRFVTVGDMALPGKPLVKVTSATGLYLDIKLPAGITSKSIRLDDHVLPLTPKNLAGPNGLREYRAQLPEGSSAVEGELLKIALVVYAGEGVLLPDDALLSAQGRTWVFAYTNKRVEKMPVTIEQRGIEGVTVKEDLAGRTLLLAKPDILLRASSGVPVMIRSTRTHS